MNRPEAEVIAAAVAIIRPEWYQTSLLKMLGKIQHRPARQVALALVSLAYDPEVQSPGLLLHEGPHWAVGHIGEATYTPPAAGEEQCRIHGQRQPCGGCRADRLAIPAEPIAPPELERAEGESLVQYARRIADLHNPNESTEQEQQ